MQSPVVGWRPMRGKTRQAMSKIRFTFVIIFSAWCLLISAHPLLSQGNPAAEAERQARQFQNQYESVTGQLNKIPDDVKKLDEIIQKNKNPENAIEGLQDFRRALSNALSAVVDNGSLEQLSHSYVSFLEKELQNAKNDKHFDDNKRNRIIDGWQKKLTEARNKTSILDKERAELSMMLIDIQTNEDYLVEMLRIDKQAEVIDILDKLVDDLHHESEHLKDIQMNIPSN
jgi:hypothetical protein